MCIQGDGNWINTFFMHLLWCLTMLTPNTTQYSLDLSALSGVTCIRPGFPVKFKYNLIPQNVKGDTDVCINLNNNLWFSKFKTTIMPLICFNVDDSWRKFSLTIHTLNRLWLVFSYCLYVIPRLRKRVPW